MLVFPPTQSDSVCCPRLLPGSLKDALDVCTWRRCYSLQEVNSALSRVQLVGYSQKVVRTTLLPDVLEAVGGSAADKLMCTAYSVHISQVSNGKKFEFRFFQLEINV